MLTMKGGYKLIDLGGKNLNSPQYVPGAYDAVASRGHKALMVGNFRYYNELRSADYYFPLVNSDNFILNNGYYKITIRNNDMVSLAEA